MGKRATTIESRRHSAGAQVPAKKIISKQEHLVNRNWTKLQPQVCTKQKQEVTLPVKRPSKSLPQPVSSDSRVTRIIAMDCEMVGVGPEGKKSALARVSIVNSFGNVLYDAYVKPMEFVTDFRTSISGIRYADVKDGQNLEDVQKKVSELLSGRILVGHALHHDLKVLFLSHPKPDIRDTSLYPPFRNDVGRPRSLRHLVELILGANIQTAEHDSVEDARAAMMLYTKVETDWEKSLRLGRKKTYKKSNGST